jgi:hypothetical protein
MTHVTLAQGVKNKGKLSWTIVLAKIERNGAYNSRTVKIPQGNLV